jgi:hypothetical protein
MFEQHGENLKRLLAESDALATFFTQFSGSEVEYEVLETSYSSTASLVPHLAPRMAFRILDHDSILMIYALRT